MHTFPDTHWWDQQAQGQWGFGADPFGEGGLDAMAERALSIGHDARPRIPVRVAQPEPTRVDEGFQSCV